MTNDLIANPNSLYDDLCNQIILYSSFVASKLGVSYSELWLGITILIILLFIWYNILLLSCLYFNSKRTVKWLLWISNIIILIISFFTLSDFLVYCRYNI